MDENERPSEMPQNIGRYQVLESVGFGAMGAVYKAFDPLIKRTLAIKTIRLDIPRQSPQYKSFIDRFYHEARISGTLSHPNIVTLFDIGEEGGLPYLAMEFVEGETILGILEKGQRFKPEKVIGLVSQMASAIDYAHSKGVIHRDIKPSNVILYETDKVKVTDFGIAKLVDAEMTQSGTLLGTPSYMSPEQAMGEKLDGRSDIFSLGVCAFEMLSGEQPFPGTNVTSILYKLVHVDPIEPTDLEMHGLVPQKWHEVFSRVLAKKPDDRYQTATEFVQDLEYCLGSWFGAVPDMTLSESAESTLAGKVAAAAVAPPDARKTGPRAAPPPAAPPPSDEPVEVTVSMPSPSFEDRRPRAVAQDEAAPTTMFMSAREVAEAGQPAAAPPAPAVPAPPDVPPPPAPAPAAPPSPVAAAPPMASSGAVPPCPIGGIRGHGRDGGPGHDFGHRSHRAAAAAASRSGAASGTVGGVRRHGRDDVADRAAPAQDRADPDSVPAAGGGNGLDVRAAHSAQRAGAGPSRSAPPGALRPCVVGRRARGHAGDGGAQPARPPDASTGATAASGAAADRTDAAARASTRRRQAADAAAAEASGGGRRRPCRRRSR